jgi:transposase-like protein
MKQRKKEFVGNRWVRDPVKEQYWKRHLALWQRSGLSIRAYCKENGVVEASFYSWRRELIIRAREDGSAEQVACAEGVTPNTVKDGRGRTVRIRFRQTDQAALLKEGEKSNPFVPIHIVQDRERLETNMERQNVEIALPGGAVIHLNGECNVRLVAELLSALKGQGEA